MENQESSSDASENSEEVTAGSVEALQKELQELRGRHKFALEESKKNSEKYKALRSEQERKQQEALEKAGKWEEAYKLERENANRLSETLVTIKKETAREKLKNQVMALAPNAYDVGDIMMAPSFSENIRMDDEGNWLNVSEALEAVKKEKPYYFKTARSPVQVNQMPRGTPDSYEVAIRKTTNQKEYDAVRKQYGKD